MPTPRKPRHLHLLQGTYRPDRHPEPQGATPINPAPPEHLPTEFVPAWREIIAAGGEYLAESDRLAVELAAVLTVKVRSGEVTAAVTAQYMNLLSKLGCTPAGRRGLEPVRPASNRENPFEDLSR